MKNSHYGDGVNLAKTVLVGLGASCAAAFVGMCVAALLILRENLAISNLAFCIPFLHFVVLFAGCFTAGIMSREKVLYTNGIIVVVLYFLCAGMTVLIYDGQFSGVIGDLGAGLLGALCAVLICIRQLKSGKRRYRKRKIC